MPDQVEDLKVWRKSVDLVKFVYISTASFPKEEIYGLTSQMRRAAVSISANIAEGRGRVSKKEFAQFLFVARGSAYELSTLVIIAREVGFLRPEDEAKCQEEIGEVLSMLNGLIRSIK